MLCGNTHLGVFPVNVLVAADVAEDLEGFILPADRGEVARRVGEHADAEEKENGRDALEGQKKAPAW